MQKLKDYRQLSATKIKVHPKLSNPKKVTVSRVLSAKQRRQFKEALTSKDREIDFLRTELQTLRIRDKITDSVLDHPLPPPGRQS